MKYLLQILTITLFALTINTGSFARPQAAVDTIKHQSAAIDRGKDVTDSIFKDSHLAIDSNMISIDDKEYNDDSDMSFFNRFFSDNFGFVLTKDDFYAFALTLLLIFIFSPVFFVIILFLYMHHRSKMRYKLIQNAIDKGYPIDKFTHCNVIMTDLQYMNRGVKKVCIAGGVLLANIFFIDLSIISIVSFIVIFYGIYQIIVSYKIGKKIKNNNDSDSEFIQ